jgi:hypothetical protein
VFALYNHDVRIAVLLGTLLCAFLGVVIAVPILAFDCASPVFSQEISHES